MYVYRFTLTPHTILQEVEAARQAAESAEADHETAVAEHRLEEELHSHGLQPTPYTLHHISHCKIVCGTQWSNRWTYRVFIMHIRRD